MTCSLLISHGVVHPPRWGQGSTTGRAGPTLVDGSCTMRFFSKSDKPKCEHVFGAAHWRIRWSMRMSPSRCDFAAKEWLPEYRAEGSTGDSILQRQCRLRELKLKTQSEKNELGKGLPNETAAKLNEEIKQMEIEYRSHQVRLKNQERATAPNAEEAEERKLFHKHRDRHGRTYAWIYEQGRCADFGGCCGRTCGCCEKPLRRYLRPTSGGKKKLIEVRVHCTAECAGCIGSQRYYKLHGRLPPTAFTSKDC